MNPFSQPRRKPLTTSYEGLGLTLSHEWQADEWAICDGPIDADDVLALTLASLRDMQAASLCVSDWLRQGRPIEDIYLHGITSAARLQGLWWTRDQLDFSALTVGCSRLHRLLYELSPVFLADAEPPQDATVLMLPEPDSQHTMGLFMLSEFYRRAGWQTQLLQPHQVADAERIVAANWVDVVAISIGSDRHFDYLRHLIGQLRQKSPNPNIQVIAGGPMALLMPEVLSDLGIDWVGVDAPSTVAKSRANLSNFANN